MFRRIKEFQSKIMLRLMYLNIKKKINLNLRYLKTKRQEGKYD